MGDYTPVLEDNLWFVIGGGGMRVSHACGVVGGMVDFRGIKQPDGVIGMSGGILPGTYWASGQTDSIIDVCDRGFYSSRDFVNPHRISKIMDPNYVVDTLITKLDPLDTDAVKNSPTNLIIPAMARDGHVEYFTNRDGSDIKEVIRVGMSIPLIGGWDPWREMDGVEYADSAFTAKPKNHLEEAVNQGATRIVVIDNNSDKVKQNGKGTIGEWFVETVHSYWNHIKGTAQEKLYLEAKERAENYQVPDDVRVLTIKPEGEKISLTDNKPETLVRTHKIGRDRVEFDEEITEFIETPNPR